MTAEEFKIKFPAFDLLSNDAIQGIIDFAGTLLCPNSFANRIFYDRLFCLLVAHYLTLDELARITFESGGQLSTSESVSGEANVSLDNSLLTADKSNQSMYQSTIYGQQYLSLLKVNTPTRAASNITAHSNIRF